MKSNSHSGNVQANTMQSVKVTKAIIHVYNQLRKQVIFGLRVWHKGKLNKVATLYMSKRHSFAVVFSTSNSVVCTHNIADWPWCPASKKVRSIWKLQETRQPVDTASRYIALKLIQIKHVLSLLLCHSNL